MRDLSYLKGKIGNLKKNGKRDSGLSVCMECGMPKIAVEIMELRQNLYRYDGIREPYWRPLVLNKLTVACKCRQTSFRLKIH